MQDFNPTDEHLIVLIQQGDKSAFKILFERHYKLLLATAINMLKDVNTAKDVTQEVFLKIWHKRTTIQVKGAVIAYLKRAVINQAINHINAKKRFVSDEVLRTEQSNTADATQQLEAQDVEKTMRQALNTLPERCRIIFVMRRLEGMRVKEIAEQLNISPKTVENQLTKALKVLKTAIQPFLKENSS